MSGWLVCVVCSGAHHTVDCAKAQEIVRTHVGLPKASPLPFKIEIVPDNIVELHQPGRAFRHVDRQPWRARTAERVG